MNVPCLGDVAEARSDLFNELLYLVDGFAVVIRTWTVASQHEGGDNTERRKNLLVIEHFSPTLATSHKASLAFIFGILHVEHCSQSAPSPCRKETPASNSQWEAKRWLQPDVTGMLPITKPLEKIRCSILLTLSLPSFYLTPQPSGSCA